MCAAEYNAGRLREIDARAKEIGRDIFRQLPEERPSVLDRRWWDDQVMAWSMRDEAVKVELFRFVDVLPMLHSNEAVTGRLEEYLSEVKDRLPSSIRVALGVARRTPGVRAAVAKAARLAAMDFARRFIAGTNAKEVLAAALREREQGRGFTLDILGEAVTSDREADGYFNAYRGLLEEVAPAVNSWEERPQIDRGVLGPLPRMNLSIKLSALDCRFDALDFHGSTRRAAQRLRDLLRVAAAQQAFINIDMEQYAKKELTLQVFKSVLNEEEFRTVGDVGIVVQCYLKDSYADLVALRDWAAQRGKPVWVRLVKGAYWDYETIHARYHHWPTPVFQQKPASDAMFERCTRFVMEQHQHLRPALGSHNIRSLAYAIASAEQAGLPPAGLEIQMLYGMADAEKKVFVDRGHRLRVYMPYGELIPGMAYLVRRLLENTSNDSFLRMSFADKVPVEQLLADPSQAAPACDFQPEQEPTEMSSADSRADRTAAETNPLAAFKNEPPVDFAKADNREAMHTALADVAGRLQRDYPLIIDGRPVEAEQRLESLDPSHSGRVVGVTSAAEPPHVEQAVAAATRAAAGWAAEPVERRAELLRRAAASMRDRLFELSAWIVYECGKPWREATGDVCEAIDFCEYYAAGALQMFGGDGADAPGEDNRFSYIPRGVAAVIAPWNFPLAILTGMTTAALVTGNPVIMKPAEQSPVTAAKLMEIFASLDLPPGVLQYLPGRGETAGAALVAHRDVALIAFTGSRQVGLSINRTAAEVSADSSTGVKRVIAELGGKNAIIVDVDADLDEAVLGTVHSAFGYAGQKCSACSRVIVLAEVYDAFVARLVEAARSLQVGPAEDPAATVGPVIDEESLARIQQYLEIGRREADEVLSVETGRPPGEGCYVGPHIFAGVDPQSRLAQEEIFGPVLAVIRAENLDEALQIANGTDYALTGGFYSRSPANIDRVARELMVGNLYLNRNITGAMVGRQPFGGFRMSGIGSKAGGPDYLLQFVLPRTITENTLRRGFAPPPETQ